MVTLVVPVGSTMLEVGGGEFIEQILKQLGSSQREFIQVRKHDQRKYKSLSNSIRKFIKAAVRTALKRGTRPRQKAMPWNRVMIEALSKAVARNLGLTKRSLKKQVRGKRRKARKAKPVLKMIQP